MRKCFATAVLFFVVAGAFCWVYRLPWISNGDPDRFYHIALSRMAVESRHMVLRSVPQVEDLGWGDYFIDKEFLFHQLTYVGYFFGGESGVSWTATVCALLSILTFYLFTAGRLPLALTAMLTVATFASPYIAYRQALLRPHTLAILTFMLMNVFALSRKPRLTAVAAALFVLSYHAFYVPMILLGWLFALSYSEEAEEGKIWRRVAIFGEAGCLAGLLANPYFPGNIVMAVIHARIPSLMKTELSSAQFGEELVPVRADHYLEIFFGPMLVLFLAILFLGIDFGRREDKGRSFRVPLPYLLGAGVFFLVLSFQISRVGEYLIPVCGLLLVLIAERWREYGRWTLALGIAFAVAQVSYSADIFRHRMGHEDNNPRVFETFKAIEAIPRDPKGAKVFNCEWDRSPYIFYARPDLRFVDILDPSLLYFANRGAYKAIAELRGGTAPDSYGLIRHAFHASFVLCNDPNITNRLRSDPGFRQLYPKSANPGQSVIVPTLFEVLPEAPVEYLRSVSVGESTIMSGKELQGLRPPAATLPRKEVDLDHTPYVNFAAYNSGEAASENLRCAYSSPSDRELKRLAGADYLGVGGGPGFKIWRNGQALFSSRTGFPDALGIQVLVPLRPSLTAHDKIDVLSCSSAGSRFWGVQLSLWTKRGVLNHCAQMRSGLSSPGQGSPWYFEGIQTLTCLGPLAAPQPIRVLSTSNRD